MVNRYFEKIERIISGFREIITKQVISKKTYNDTQGMVSGEIEFIDDSELSFMELKNTEQREKKKYKYHYMDNTKQMIFRYDNAKHHPEIETFPHHKHTTENIEESNEPDLIDVLSEIHDKMKSEKENKKRTP